MALAHVLLLLFATHPVKVVNLACTVPAGSAIDNRNGGFVDNIALDGDTTRGCLIYTDNDHVTNVEINGVLYEKCGPTKGGLTPCIVAKKQKPTTGIYIAPQCKGGVCECTSSGCGVITGDNSQDIDPSWYGVPDPGVCTGSCMTKLPTWHPNDTTSPSWTYTMVIDIPAVQVEDLRVRPDKWILDSYEKAFAQGCEEVAGAHYDFHEHACHHPKWACTDKHAILLAGEDGARHCLSFETYQGSIGFGGYTPNLGWQSDQAH